MKKFNPIRLVVFFIAVVALSKFFEAGRLMAEERTFVHFGASVFSLIIFAFTLLIMGYWVYIEEKEKNNLRNKFGIYEWFYRKRDGETAMGRIGGKRGQEIRGT